MARLRDTGDKRAEARQPQLLLALGAVLTIALLVLVAILSTLSLQAADQSAKNYLEAEGLAGEIVRLDELLTMSARMAAATGNLEWIDRHEANVGPLDDALARITELGDEGLFDVAGLTALNDASDVLLSLENEAFDFVRRGRSHQAARLLETADYDNAKSSYTDTITRLSNDIAAGISTRIAGDQTSRVVAAILSALAVVAALAIWFSVWRSMTAWQRRADVAERARDAAQESQRRELKRSQRVLASLSDNSPIDWWTVDRDGVFTARGGQDPETFDAVAEVALVRPVDQPAAAGLTFFDLMAGKPEAIEGMRAALRGSPFNRRLQIGKKTVQSVFLPIVVDGEVNEVVGISTDVSVENELAQELQHQTEHDSLTGLLNRAGFQRRVDARLADNGKNATMIMLDLSGLRELNDLRSHEVGDYALTVVARRIEAIVGPDALAARVGGDEFCVFEQGRDAAEAGQLAEELVDSITSPIAAPDGALALAAFAGVDGPPLSGTSFQQVLPALDVSANEARRRGRNSVARFSPSMIADFAKRVSLTREIEQAILDRQFSVVYQPIWDAQTGQVRAAEALARWMHPTRGQVSPAEFIPHASAAGLVGDIDALIVEQACRDLGTWRELHREMDNIQLSVNLSAENLADDNLTERIGALCSIYGLAPEDLIFELTETAAVDNLGVAQRSLGQMREVGYRIALDDFGTGYSSLSQLQNLAVDVLKVDRSFVSGDVSPTQSELCEMIVGLAKVLQLRVVAEGVETEQQLRTMRGLGCDFVQGYLLARPMVAADFLELVTDMHTRSHEAFKIGQSAPVG